jgi:ATP adenylyltransferase
MGAKKKAVNLSHARTDFQRKVMEQIAKDKVCPFCEKHFLKYHTKPILKKGKHWILTSNFQPYIGTKHHLLAVSRKHTTTFANLPSAAHAELFKLFADEGKKRGIQGGGIFMRYGDTDYTGATVSHLHAHLITGAKRGKGKEMQYVMLGYKRNSTSQG